MNEAYLKTYLVILKNKEDIVVKAYTFKGCISIVRKQLNIEEKYIEGILLQ